MSVAMLQAPFRHIAPSAGPLQAEEAAVMASLERLDSRSARPGIDPTRMSTEGARFAVTQLHLRDSQQVCSMVAIVETT